MPRMEEGGGRRCERERERAVGGTITTREQYISGRPAGVVGLRSWGKSGPSHGAMEAAPGWGLALGFESTVVLVQQGKRSGGLGGLDSRQRAAGAC